MKGLLVLSGLGTLQDPPGGAGGLYLERLMSGLV